MMRHHIYVELKQVRQVTAKKVGPGTVRGPTVIKHIGELVALLFFAPKPPPPPPGEGSDVEEEDSDDDPDDRTRTVLHVGLTLTNIHTTYLIIK